LPFTVRDRLFLAQPYNALLLCAKRRHVACRESSQWSARDPEAGGTMSEGSCCTVHRKTFPWLSSIINALSSIIVAMDLSFGGDQSQFLNGPSDKRGRLSAVVNLYSKLQIDAKACVIIEGAHADTCRACFQSRRRQRPANFECPSAHRA